MKLMKYIYLIGLWFSATSLAATAQVEKAVVEARGMRTCPVCDMALEVALARVAGAGKVSLDSDKQTFTIFYKPNSNFRSKELREAAAKAKLQVVQIRVTARGRVQDRDEFQFFASGQERYALVKSPRLPDDGPLVVSGIVDDLSDTYGLQLKVESYKRVKD